ncbi:MAG: ABC transporter ATP-binding protein [Anaerolineales bacterium]
MLITRSLTIGYPRKPLASNLDLELRPGEMVCLLGPNGVGKSTLLRTLAGMQPALGGKVLLNGRDIHSMPASELARHLAVVLTTRLEVGHLPVYTLVSLGRHPYTNWFGLLRARDHAAIRRALEYTDSLSLADRFFHELSDGERQRVLIARALAQEPQVLLLDEPTAFLDLPRRIETLRLLRRLARQTGCAVLLSIHDLDLALRLADRLWVLSAEGTLEVGIPEELALNGALERAFRREGIEFDATIGTFRLHTPTLGTVHLSHDGEGVAMAWTWRALERLGYQVYNGVVHSLPTVQVLPGPRWQVTTAQGRREFDSLGELIEFMKKDDRPWTVDRKERTVDGRPLMDGES